MDPPTDALRARGLDGYGDNVVFDKDGNDFNAKFGARTKMANRPRRQIMRVRRRVCIGCAGFNVYLYRGGGKHDCVLQPGHVDFDDDTAYTKRVDKVDADYFRGDANGRGVVHIAVCDYIGVAETICI